MKLAALALAAALLAAGNADAGTPGTPPAPPALLHKIAIDARGPLALVEVTRAVVPDPAEAGGGNEAVLDLALPDGGALVSVEVRDGERWRSVDRRRRRRPPRGRRLSRRERRQGRHAGERALRRQRDAPSAPASQRRPRHGADPGPLSILDRADRRERPPADPVPSRARAHRRRQPRSRSTCAAQPRPISQVFPPPSRRAPATPAAASRRVRPGRSPGRHATR